MEGFTNHWRCNKLIECMNKMCKDLFYKFPYLHDFIPLIVFKTRTCDLDKKKGLVGGKNKK